MGQEQRPGIGLRVVNWRWMMMLMMIHYAPLVVVVQGACAWRV